MLGTPLPARPAYIADAPPLRRGVGSLHVFSPTGDLVIDGLTDFEVDLALSLDGTRTLDHVLLLASIGPNGLPPPSVDARERRSRFTEVLVALTQAGSIGDRMDRPARRPAAHTTVLVHGEGPVPSAVASLLRRTRIARVTRETPDRPGPDVVGLPAVVVLTADTVVPPRLVDPWQARGVVHLPVTVTSTAVVVGPVGGRPGDPCMRCVEMTRAERDVARPIVLAQLAGRGRTPRPGPALVDAASGVIAMITADLLSGADVGAGLTFELASPGTRLGHRRWEPHPDCPAHEIGQDLLA